MIGWDKWCTLLAVFRHGTFKQAAHTLAIDASTVGRRLKILERDLGYELFLRANDKLVPTQKCEVLLTHLEVAAEALRNAEQQTAGLEPGAVWREVRMTAPPFLITNLFAPAMNRLTENRRMRVDLVATDNKAMLSRREVDIAIRIEDGPRELNLGTDRIDATRIGVLEYAVYAATDSQATALPWAGIVEQHLRTSGSRTIADLAGKDTVQYQALHFETLREIVATGIARAMLPRFLADTDSRLRVTTETVLEQTLWMLSHRPDRNVGHLTATRTWITDLATEKLGFCVS